MIAADGWTGVDELSGGGGAACLVVDGHEKVGKEEQFLYDWETVS